MVLRGSKQRGARSYEAIKIQRRTDYLCAASTRCGYARRGGVSATWGVAGDVLQLEEEVRTHGGCGVARTAQLREENDRLKRLVADLTLNKQILSDVVKKKL